MVNELTRRQAVILTAAAAAASAVDIRHASAEGSKVAETIFHNGTILTMVDATPRVAAIAVGDGRILASGDEASVMALKGDTTTLVDLKGATLLPSFIDAHGHFMNAPQILGWVNVQGVPAGPVQAIPDVIAALDAYKAKNSPKPGDWIIGYGYDMTNLAEGRDMTRGDLDPNFPDNPVMLIHSSNHGCVLNSAGFKAVGMDASTKTPPGGLILREPGSNEPAGLIMETAFLPIFAKMPQPSENEMLARLDAAQQIYAMKGVTTCQEGATHVGDLDFLRKGAEKGLLYLDIVSLPLFVEVPKMVTEYFPSFSAAGGAVPLEAASAFGIYKNRLKLGGIKFACDGSPQGKTAFWSKPLLTPGPAGEANWRGQPLFPPELINKAVAEAVSKNIPVFAHCNGDAAIDMMIDALRLAGVKAEQDRRSVIVHSQFMRPDQLDAYVELGITPSYFTAHTFFWGDIHLENLGQERAFFLSPMKSAQSKAIRFSNHNDFSVTPLEPMRMVQTAMDRLSRKGVVIGPDERVDVWTALKALTIEAAFQIREEKEKGTLEPGKLADLVILATDPTMADVEKISAIEVVETFKEGKSVYKKKAA